MRSAKHRFLMFFVGIFFGVMVIPATASLAFNLTRPQAQLSEEVAVYLPAIVSKSNLTSLIFVAGPIQSFDEDDIYMVNAKGSGLVNLTNYPSGYFDPTWSPDSSRIVFMSNRGGGTYIMQEDGTGLTQLAADGGSPSWSPDSSMLVLSSLAELFIIDTDGSGRRELVAVDDNFLIDAPNWSPNGNKIAYYWSNRIGQTDIYVVNPDGSGITNLTNGFGGSDPVWSPDGSKILFGDSGEIYVMNADGSERTNISNSLEYNATYVWSPDGTKIAFDCDSGQICVMNSDGSGKTNVSGVNSAYSGPVWAPNGSVLAFVEGSFASPGTIHTVKPDGTGKTIFTDLPSGTQKRGLAWRPLAVAP